MTFKSSLLNTCNRFKEAIVLTAIIFLLFLLQIILFSIFAVSIDLDGEIDAIAIIIIIIALVKFGMSVNNYILDFSFLLIMVVMFSFVFFALSVFMGLLLTLLLFIFGWYLPLLIFLPSAFLITSLGFLIVITIWTKNIKKHSHSRWQRDKQI